MKKTFSALATAAAVTMIAGSANAQGWGDWMPWNLVRGDETYVSVKAGMTAMQDAKFDTGASEFEDGWAANAAVGKYMNPNWRGEVELGFNKNSQDGVGRAEAMTGMLNAYYEPFANCRLKPFVGAGVGIANVDFDGMDDDTTWAMQGMAGASYQINTNLAATAEYRYLQTGELDVGTANSPRYQNHAGLVGLRVKF